MGYRFCQLHEKLFCNITKIPSALIIDNDLCKAARNCNDTLIISTGMSTENEISAAVDCCFQISLCIQIQRILHP